MKKLFENAGHMGEESLFPHTPISFKDIPKNCCSAKASTGLNNTLGNKQALSSPNPFPQEENAVNAGSKAILGDDAPASIAAILDFGINQLGVPQWYTQGWCMEMSSRGWRTKQGSIITPKNWQYMLNTFWTHATPKEKEHYERAYAEAVAAQALEEQLPPIEVTRVHWHECQRTCANFKKGKCICGYRTPAFMEPACHGCTERCLHFSPLPWAWQQAWMFSFWETWKNTRKGLALAAYFAEHPDELEEAKWRNDAFEPTEKDCFEANRRYNGYVWKPYPAGVRPL